MKKVSNKRILNTDDLGALDNVTKDFEIFKSRVANAVLDYMDGQKDSDLVECLEKTSVFLNNISFQIATVERNALILYNTDGNKIENSHFIALEIINGLLRYSINLGNGIVRIMSDVVISDGIWHTVMAVRDKQVRTYWKMLSFI